MSQAKKNHREGGGVRVKEKFFFIFVKIPRGTKIFLKKCHKKYPLTKYSKGTHRCTWFENLGGGVLPNFWGRVCSKGLRKFWGRVHFLGVLLHFY
jgi:hypothetical protein